MSRFKMGSNTFKYDDNDDYGIPKLIATQKIPLHLRYRNYALAAGCILLFFIWTRMRNGDNTDWSKLAYVQYVSDSHSLCNAVMVFEALKRLGSKADRVLLYPSDWSPEWSSDRDSQLLIVAKKNYGVKLKPIQLLNADGATEPGTLKLPSGFDSSISKLRLWESDEYERIIHFDSDVLVQHHLDELFFLPSSPMAMAREYWSDKPRDQWPLSTALMVLQPDAAETKSMWETLQSWRLDPDHPISLHYDTDVINERFAGSAMVLPHRPYLLQSSEFRMHDHSAYMGSWNGPERAIQWDAQRMLKEAKLIHFDDWPLPKPWVMWPSEGLKEIQPDCDNSHTDSCAERELWKGLYDEFRHRRKDICKILSVPAPNWEKWKESQGYE